VTKRGAEITNNRGREKGANRACADLGPILTDTWLSVMWAAGREREGAAFKPSVRLEGAGIGAVGKWPIRAFFGPRREAVAQVLVYSFCRSSAINPIEITTLKKNIMKTTLGVADRILKSATRKRATRTLGIEPLSDVGTNFPGPGDPQRPPADVRPVSIKPMK